VTRDGAIRTVDESFIRDAVIEAAERWRLDVKPLAIAAAETMMPDGCWIPGSDPSFRDRTLGSSAAPPAHLGHLHSLLPGCTLGGH